MNQPEYMSAAMEAEEAFRAMHANDPEPTCASCKHLGRIEIAGKMHYICTYWVGDPDNWCYETDAQDEGCEFHE